MGTELERDERLILEHSFDLVFGGIAGVPDVGHINNDRDNNKDEEFDDAFEQCKEEHYYEDDSDAQVQRIGC
jgi:hypothetical protein